MEFADMVKRPWSPACLEPPCLGMHGQNDTRHLCQPLESSVEKEYFADDRQFFDLKPLIDKASGRAVIPGTFKIGRRHVVWDFSLIYRDSTWMIVI